MTPLEETYSSKNKSKNENEQRNLNNEYNTTPSFEISKTQSTKNIQSKNEIEPRNMNKTYISNNTPSFEINSKTQIQIESFEKTGSQIEQRNMLNNEENYSYTPTPSLETSKTQSQIESLEQKLFSIMNRYKQSSM